MGLHGMVDRMGMTMGTGLAGPACTGLDGGRGGAE